MITLRAVAIEGGIVIATDSEGRQFHVEIDDTLRSRLRDAPSASSSARKLSPREIQTQIRSGMSADEVAHITGAPLDYIQRYEGPVLAEREYVVESALGVPVHAADDADPESPPPTFGAVIGERLVQLSARSTQWSSWKEEAGGWILKLSFSADGIDHDARWRFDPKKLTLAPLNAEAVALSQQGDIGSTLMPRLRAVPADHSRDSSRFDSAAFQLPADLAPEAPPAPAPEHVQHSEPLHTEPIAFGRGRVIEPRTGAVSIVEDKAAQEGETADLLEALRRRRGEREAAAFEAAGFEAQAESDARPSTSTATIRVLGTRKRDDAGQSNQAASAAAPNASATASASTPTATRPRAVERTPAATESSAGSKPRRGRTSMPTWDEIVFGARPDDEN